MSLPGGKRIATTTAQTTPLCFTSDAARMRHRVHLRRHRRRHLHLRLRHLHLHHRRLLRHLHYHRHLRRHHLVPPLLLRRFPLRRHRRRLHRLRRHLLHRHRLPLLHLRRLHRRHRQCGAATRVMAIQSLPTTASATTAVLVQCTLTALSAQTVPTAPHGFTLRLLRPLCLRWRLHLHLRLLRHSATFGDSLQRRLPRGASIAASYLREITRAWVRQATRLWH
mmetsp:Transcript_15809/g.37735  ORF Transcript_15809/g.37735 Transcript_15809/m.37735 type:complete len:223 (-) Transcript_15809:1829-2497(-)